MTKIVAAFFAITVFLAIFFEVSLLVSGTFYLFSSYFFVFYQFFRSKIENHKLESEIHTIIERLILYMSSGSSIEAATDKVLLSLNHKISSRLRLILRQEASKNIKVVKNRRVRKFLQIYFYILSNRHQSLVVLESFRKQLLVESDFKSRLSRSMMNIYMQLVVLAVLYFVAVSYSVHIGQSLKNWVLVSFSLVLTGLLLFIYRIRSFQWTV